MSESRTSRRLLRRLTGESFTPNLFRKGRENIARVEEAAATAAATSLPGLPGSDRRQTFRAPNGQTMTVEVDHGEFWFTHPNGTFRFKDRDMALQFIDVLESAWEAGQ